MSSAANWSYTATATIWPFLGRDDWTRVEQFGPPVQFLCDYAAKAERRIDGKGVEFVTRQLIYTERAGIKQQDRVLIGASTEANPITAGALEVRAINRNADTLERLADDYEVAT